MKQIPYNTDTEGCASCIKANYYKMGGANFIGHTNDGLKATCVIETMDKRLTQLLESGIEITDTCMLDTYNQQVQDNVSCTIRTNINTANHHFIMEKESIIFDDYNQRIPQDQDCIGTITTNIGNSAPRNGYKIIEPQIQSCENNQSAPKVINPLKGESQYGWHFEQEVYDQEGITRAVKSAEGSGNIPKVLVPSYRIRKLTERECFRLMGLADTDITKIQASGVSRSQQYKMAGNSIVVDVLFHIFRKLYIEPQCEHQQLTLF